MDHCFLALGPACFLGYYTSREAARKALGGAERGYALVPHRGGPRQGTAHYFTYDSGEVAYVSGDPDEALEVWKELARAGMVDSDHPEPIYRCEVDRVPGWIAEIEARLAAAAAAAKGGTVAETGPDTAVPDGAAAPEGAAGDAAAGAGEADAAPGGAAAGPSDAAADSVRC